jgi:ATP-binding cassette subfamily B protein
LRDVSLHLPAGKVVALVGENGAGKTTLVKLLTRFYEPTNGRILLDGVELRRLDLDAWRGRISTAFQDFARFDFVIREAVGVGDLPQIEDHEAVHGALARAGAADIASSLPGGLETQLGRDWPGGVELSGGQWQRLALGRAFMRWGPTGHPLLVVFDEPTAAIDAPTEHALFERLAAAARSGAIQGTVTLLISHRFSTVRMADRILVLDGGRIVEQGSHDELRRQGGVYAELYELQAAAYR